jgi:putative ABC transport system permease protein
VEVYRHEIGPEYFATLGIPLVAGRAMDDRDTAASARVLVVNATIVKRFFGGDNAIAHRSD